VVIFIGGEVCETLTANVVLTAMAAAPKKLTSLDTFILSPLFSMWQIRRGARAFRPSGLFNGNIPTAKFLIPAITRQSRTATRALRTPHPAILSYRTMSWTAGNGAKWPETADTYVQTANSEAG
jgi:hypothetical protein